MAHHHLLHSHISGKKRVTFFDRLMLAAAFVYPATAIPQVIQVLEGKTEGVSMVSWAGFAGFVSLFLAYSIIHRIKPMIITYTMWLTIDLIIVFNLLLNR